MCILGRHDMADSLIRHIVPIKNAILLYMSLSFLCRYRHIKRHSVILGNPWQEMPVQGADGIRRLHSQDGQRQQNQCFNSRHGRSFKIYIYIYNGTVCQLDYFCYIISLTYKVALFRILLCANLLYIRKCLELYFICSFRSKIQPAPAVIFI